MIIEKYQLNFRMAGESPAVDSIKDYSILSHFLMHWDNPDHIVNNLIPLINRGMKFGTKDRWRTYESVSGLKEKMFKQWEAYKIDNPKERWEKIKIWKGFYIEEEESFLEGIDADVVGSAFVTFDTTVLNGSDLNFKDIEIPSNDFKEIVLEWLYFILKNKMILPKQVVS